MEVILQCAVPCKRDLGNVIWSNLHLHVSLEKNLSRCDGVLENSVKGEALHFYLTIIFDVIDEVENLFKFGS